MSDGAFDAAAYCAMCDAPCAIGPLCHGCRAAGADDDHEDTLNWESTAELAFITMMNGNLTDGINLIMYDGDVRIDSVRAALRLVSHYHNDHEIDIDYIIDLIIRLIERWELK